MHKYLLTAMTNATLVAMAKDTRNKITIIATSKDVGDRLEELAVYNELLCLINEELRKRF